MEDKVLYIGLAVLVIAVIGMFLLFGGQGQEDINEQQTVLNQGNQQVNQGQDQNVQQNQGNQQNGAAGDENIRVITVEGNEFKFTPAEISVKKGERIRIVFRNTGSLPHDFVIEGTPFRTRIISPGETDVIEFTATETTTYTFYCSVGTHRQLGMEGTLEVS